LSVDEILLLGRIAFLAALYLFLVILAVLLRRELRSRASTSDGRAPADLLVIEPYETNLEPGERIPLLASTTLGRAEGNDIVLGDTFASGQHARLGWNGKGWVLEDMGSTNGTYVNGQQVHRTVAIKPGDIIELGRVKVKLVPL
jgi:pSer/pThr/pTyr-binding forkhead associated (FHA) protein